MNKFYNKPKKIDLVVESLNKKIARLLGKSGKLIKQPKKTSNFMFWFIILLVIIFLWITTGLYILGEGFYGIILSRGKFSTVEKGFKVGMLLPYPLTKIILVDAEPTYLQYLGEDGGLHNTYHTSLSEVDTIGVVAQFSYQITDPKKFYMEYIHHSNNNKFNSKTQDKLREEIKTLIKNIINQNLLSNGYKDYCFKNLTVMSNDVKNQANQNLENVGIKIVKLNIISLSSPRQECGKYSNINIDGENKVLPYKASQPVVNIFQNANKRIVSRDSLRDIIRERK